MNICRGTGCAGVRGCKVAARMASEKTSERLPAHFLEDCSNYFPQFRGAATLALAEELASSPR